MNEENIVAQISASFNYIYGCADSTGFITANDTKCKYCNTELNLDFKNKCVNCGGHQ